MMAEKINVSTGLLIEALAAAGMEVEAKTESIAPLATVEDAIIALDELIIRRTDQLEEYTELMAALIIKRAVPEIRIAPKVTEDQHEQAPS